ncbi:glucokinase [bacterium BMS3Abin04]|nr:glucokinase [bacterium BMS3Abin04]
MKKEYVITVDFGGTKILTALLNSKNEIIGRVKLMTDIKKKADGMVIDIADSIKQLLKKTGVKPNSIEAVSMGVPGTVNPFTCEIGNAPNLQISNFNIKKALQKYISLPILIENDVNLAGLGIKKFEFNDKIKNMLVVFVGTGIGGALFFNGKLYRGSSFYAGEIGHMKVNSSGALSYGSDVTFEGLASRTAIVESITKQIKKKNKSVLSEYVFKNRKIKSKAIAKAIKEKDDLTIKEISKACGIIGRVLGSITTLLNFDTIVLGGGLLEANSEFMMPKIESAFDTAVIKEIGKSTKLKVTKLGDDGPLYGGIALAEEFNH